MVIRENSGGVSPEDLQAFVQLGASGQVSADSPHIGVWGQGQKLAMAALGRDATISTRYWHEGRVYELGDTMTDQVVLRMSEDWWQSEDDWDVPVYLPGGELTQGETVYELRKLNVLVDDQVLTSVRQELSSLYGTFLAEADATISLNGEPLVAESTLSEEALSKVFAYPTGFEPSRHIFDLEARQPVIEGGRRSEEVRHLRMEIIIGLTPRQQVDKAGAYMFGVPATTSGARLGPRKFVKEPVQDESIGYSTGPNSILRKGHASIGRLRMYITFSGDSEDIPWGMPGSAVKRGYNSMSPFAAEIREKIKLVAQPYAKFTSRAREIDVVPFSVEWNDMSEDARRTLVRKGANIKYEDELDEPDVRPKVVPFVRRDFQPTAFLDWDHESSDAPPLAVPAFDVKRSKEVVASLYQRDKRLKEMEGLDPAAAIEEVMNNFQQLEDLREQGWSEDEEEESRATERLIPVSFRISQRKLRQLLQLTGADKKTDAVTRAIEAYLSEHQSPTALGEAVDG